MSTSTQPRAVALTGLSSSIMLAGLLVGTTLVLAMGASIARSAMPLVLARVDEASWQASSSALAPFSLAATLLAACAAWWAWRERESPEPPRLLVTYSAQIVLTAVWAIVTFAFFPALGEASFWLGLAPLGLLVAAVVVNLSRFRRVSRLAFAMLIPFAALVAYLGSLNLALIALN